MASTRQLKTKIGAVRNIRQITRAMQMVAATKMRKAQEVALRARPYARKSLALLLHLLKYAEKEETQRIFGLNQANAKIALIVITSDKGLAGSFNSAVLRAAARFVEERGDADIVPKTGKYSELALQEEEIVRDLNYVLEPSREQILQTVVRNLIRVHIAHLVFESNASEHSARMMAMKNATENADRLQEELTLALNKARQTAITQELTEISTAKEALTAE